METKIEYPNRIIYDATYNCKKVATAIKKFVKKFPELKWIEDQEPEQNICSSEYDSYIVENDYEGVVYIACVYWK